VLPETTIDGPALSSVTGSTNRSVIAWTGTDAAHHLNVETSSDGLHFGDKRILGQTSPFRPDVTQVGQSDGGQVTVAWTGTNAARSLNVLFDVYGSSPKKLTLFNETSLAAPAVLQMGSTLFLAWTGVNAAHSLNVLTINITGTGLVPGQKTILSAFSSNTGPHLSAGGPTNSVGLNWTSRSLQPSFALAREDSNFSFIVRLPEASASAPDTTFFPHQGGPGDWIGWTGTDAAHHLNLQFSTDDPPVFGPGTKTTLGDTAFGGPALAFLGFGQIAWTGTDAAHHLNIAKFQE
jgi:hypothetical protein